MFPDSFYTYMAGGCGCGQNKSKSTVSAVVPTLNEEKYLGNCLDSLLNQTRPPDEVIVVDSGSSDDTRGIAERFNCVVIDAPRGKLNARHIGFEEATGDVVLGVDADTVYPATYVEQMVAPIKNRGAVATYGDVETDGLEGMGRSLSGPILGSMSDAPVMPGQANAVSRDAYFESGGFDFAPPSSGNGNDYDTILEEKVHFPQRLAELGEVVKVPVTVHHSERVLKGESKVAGNLASSFPKTALLSLGTAAVGLAASHNKGVGKALAGASIGFAAGEVGAKLMGQDTVREAYLHAQQDTEGEDRDKSLKEMMKTDAHIHHDMVGTLLLSVGAVLRSPEAVGTGLGLIGHHVATEGASVLGAVPKKHDEGKQVQVPVDHGKNVYEVVEL